MYSFKQLLYTYYFFSSKQVLFSIFAQINNDPLSAKSRFDSIISWWKKKTCREILLFFGPDHLLQLECLFFSNIIIIQFSKFFSKIM